jgi:3-hydroxyisobutyrate dehydrogenase-like beta-hydroxyacid dehydrogenase
MSDEHVTYGFVGLGHQGRPMARRMIDLGLEPWVWARRAEILEEFRVPGAHVAGSLAELGARCDVIGLCMLHAEATDAVLWGDGGIMSTIRAGAVLAVHGTVGTGYVEQLAELAAAQGVSVVDAPVSGGDRALTGELLVIAGGDDEALARCEPMFGTYAAQVVRAGAAGAAQSAKVVHNTLYIAIAGLLFDAFALGDALGIDAAGLGTVLGGGAAASLVFPSVIGLGHEQFAIRAWPTLHKDLELAQPLLARAGAGDTPLAVSAGAAIARMTELRAPYVAARQAEG